MFYRLMSPPFCQAGVWLAAVLCGYLGPARAVEWTTDAALQAGSYYTDNLLFALDGSEEDALAFFATPNLDFIAREANWELQGTLGVGATTFTGIDARDEFDRRARLNYRRTGPRVQWGLAAGYTVDSTLEFQTPDSGVVIPRRQIVNQSLAPDITYQLTERLGVTARYNFDDVSYEDVRSAELEDYQIQSPGLTFSYNLTTQDQLFAVLQQSDYETADGHTQFDTKVLQGGWSRTYTESTRWTLAAGARRTDSRFERCRGSFGFIFPDEACEQSNTPFTAETDRSNGSVFSASLQQQTTPVFSWSLSASRDLNPTGDGGVVETDRLGVGLAQSLNERLRATLDSSISDASYLDTSLDLDRRLLHVSPSLTYSISPRWSVTGTYNYQSQDYTDAADAEATVNALYLTVRYLWPNIYTPKF